MYKCWCSFFPPSPLSSHTISTSQTFTHAHARTHMHALYLSLCTHTNCPHHLLPQVAKHTHNDSSLSVNTPFSNNPFKCCCCCFGRQQRTQHTYTHLRVSISTCGPAHPYPTPQWSSLLAACLPGELRGPSQVVHFPFAGHLRAPMSLSHFWLEVDGEAASCHHPHPSFHIERGACSLPGDKHPSSEHRQRGSWLLWSVRMLSHLQDAVHGCVGIADVSTTTKKKLINELC